MILFSFLVMILSICGINGQTSYSCLVSFNKTTLRASDPRLISGYNDVLGPIVDLTYSDSSLLLSAKKLYPGILRHPGGTVANYWNFSNASYVTPCSTTNYNYCKWEARIDVLPKQTFSAKNFYTGIGTASPVAVKKADSIVYDLNILTLYDQQLVQQIDILNNQIGANDIKYIELGNEYYLSGYNWQFPNAQDYTKKATPLINSVRKLNPNSKIAVVAQRALPGNDKKWNDGISQFDTKNYDSVTIHDYSGDGNSLSHNDQLSFLSVYGQSVIPQYVEYVHNKFGKEKTIWMTEYNWALGSNQPFNGTMSYSVIHSMFITSYITAAICDVSSTMELLMMHEYSEQAGTNWGTKNSASFNPANANNNNGATFDVMGQILAELSYISMVKNNQMFCLDITSTSNQNEQCPTLNLNVVNNKNLKCLFGAGFNNDKDSNSFAFVIVNGCHNTINFDLDILTMVSLTNNQTLNVHQYGYAQNGGSNAKFVDCKQNVWNNDCSAVQPKYQQIDIAKNQNSISLTIDAVSIILANTP